MTDVAELHTLHTSCSIFPIGLYKLSMYRITEVEVIDKEQRIGKDNSLTFLMQQECYFNSMSHVLDIHYMLFTINNEQRPAPILSPCRVMDEFGCSGPTTVLLFMWVFLLWGWALFRLNW